MYYNICLGDYKGLPGWFGALFSHFARGCKGLSGWFGAFFPHICRLTEGGGCLKLFWQCLYRTNTFQKGDSLNLLLPLPGSPFAFCPVKSCFCYFLSYAAASSGSTTSCRFLWVLRLWCISLWVVKWTLIRSDRVWTQHSLTNHRQMTWSLIIWILYICKKCGAHEGSN